jgi:hypothetical protein
MATAVQAANLNRVFMLEWVVVSVCADKSIREDRGDVALANKV